MIDRIIVADTSVLIALSNIDQLEILKHVYQFIYVTKEVSEEFGEDLPSWIKIEEVKDNKKIELLQLELDRGEASSIVLAIEQENSQLIIDERKGRGIARRMGIKIIGLLGVIVIAKEKGIIQNVRPILKKLEEVGFRISVNLKRKILQRTGEI